MKFGRLVLVLVLFGFVGYYLSGENFLENIFGEVVSENEEIIKEDGKINVYFCPEENCSQIIVDTIQGFDVVDCAFYELRLQGVIDELKDKEYRLVVDDDTVDEVEGKINYRDDGRSGLMHNKFCVFGDYIIAGSMNPTYRGSNYNNNNLLVIKSETLNNNYRTEFEELWNQEYPGKENVVSKVEIGDVLVENYFCPEDKCEEQVLRVLSGAEESIYFMTFSFTSDSIGDLVLDKYLEGVDVKGVFETRQSGGKYSEYNYLKKNLVDVRLDGNKYTMHHKVFIVDEEIVVTGSYNPTSSGNNRNDENLLIIHDAQIAGLYLEEFERIWDEAEVELTS